jgi:sugar phosphate isomerase/epimerase
LKRVISAAPKLGVGVVNTFVGRDWGYSIEDNWPAFRGVWPALIKHAEAAGVRVGIENCPMLFSKDEWPGGKNLAISPSVWRKVFEEVPSPHFGLNLDPSHLVWQMIDIPRCVRDFGGRIVHVHAKDARVDHDRLYDVGILGLAWHTPKLPGMGDVPWGPFFSALTDAGYNGPVCIEVEDRAYEGSLADRKRSLRQSKRYLEQFISM